MRYVSNLKQMSIHCCLLFYKGYSSISTDVAIYFLMFPDPIKY